jgi:fatty acid desaturase
MHIGFLGHDIAHHHVFSSETKERWIGGAVYALGLGISLDLWTKKHNAHHKFPNQMGKDPDIKFPFVFSELQLAQYGPAYRRFVLPQQHWYFFVLLPLVYLNTIRWSIPWDVRKLRDPLRVYEFLLTVVHFGVFFWVIFGSLGSLGGSIFFLGFAIMTGAYAGFSFAPNHKGEEVIAADRPMTYDIQITSSRNVSGGALADLGMGGLNYQIEHHLFPNLPRPNLRRVQLIVKRFCKERGIPYHEVSFAESVREMYRSLRHFSKASA